MRKSRWMLACLLVGLGAIVTFSAGQVWAATTTSMITGCAPSATDTVGSPITCSATVSGGMNYNGQFMWSTTGTGTFSPASGLCTVSSSSCSITYTPTSTTGTTSLMAAYQGDTNGNAGSTSPSFPVTVDPTNPTLMVFCSPSTVTVGASSNCTADMSAGGWNLGATTMTFSLGVSSGTISFTAGNICTLPAGSGTTGSCSVVVAAKIPGPVTVNAQSTGNQNNNGVSGSGTLLITQFATTTTVACTPQSLVVGQQSQCTATVTPGYRPSGVVHWASTDSTGIFTPNVCTVNSTTHSCGVAYTVMAQATITANYMGDQNNTSSQGTFVISATVSESIEVSVANGGPSTTLGLSGCSVSINSIQANGVAQQFTAASGCTTLVVQIIPLQQSNERYLTSMNQTTFTVPPCASSSCLVISATIIFQTENSYMAVPENPAAWGSSGTIPVVGTSLGKAQATICAIAVTTGASPSSCIGWTDFSTQATMGALSVSKNQRWATGLGTFTDGTGGNVHSAEYYSQVGENFQYSSVGSTAPPSPPTLSYTSFGKASPGALSNAQSQEWLDVGSSWSLPSNLTGSSTTQRWATMTTSGPANAGQNVSVTYYDQYFVTFGFSVVGGGTAYTTPTISSTSFGASGKGSQEWVDAGSSFGFTNPLPGSTTTERWFTPTSAGIVATAGTINATYYHQYSFSVNFTVSGGGTYDDPKLNYTVLGSPGEQQLTSTVQVVWIDSGAKWGISTALPNSSPTERWMTKQATSGLSTAPILEEWLYYHQFLGTMKYSIVGAGGSPPVPSVNYTSLASSTASPMNSTARGYWMDAGSSWSVPITLKGIQGERWLANSTKPATASGAFTVDIAYAHQFYFEIGVDTAAGGQVGNFDQWESQGTSMILNSTAAKGWDFGFWQGATHTSYNGTSRFPTLTMSGPANETAMFFPGLTIFAGSDGNVGYAYGTINGIVLSGTNATIYPPLARNVTLTAEPKSVEISFSGWSGALTNGQVQSNLALNQPTAVHAFFGTDYTDIRTFAIASLGIFIAAAYVFVIRRGFTPKLKPSLSRI